MSSFIHSILFQSQPGNEQTRKLRKPPREIKTFPKNNCKYMRLGLFSQVNFLEFLTELALAYKFYCYGSLKCSAHRHTLQRHVFIHETCISCLPAQVLFFTDVSTKEKLQLKNVVQKKMR